MVLNIQPSLPKDLQQKVALDYNPFTNADNNVSEESARYNQGQLIDSLMKTASGVPLNQSLRQLTPKEQQSGIQLPPQAITEQQAFDYYRAMAKDPTGVWADPENYANLSKAQLAEIQADNPELFKEVTKRYANQIRGATEKPGFIPDLRSEKKIRRTMDRLSAFGEQMKAEGIPGILKARERVTDKKLNSLSKKNYALKEKDRTALSRIVNDFETKATNPAENSFLTEVGDGNTLQTNIEIIENDLGVTPENRKYFSSVATLALANFSDVIKKHKHNSQLVGKYFGVDPQSIETDETISPDEAFGEDFFNDIGVEDKSIPGATSKESLNNLKLGIQRRNKQPIINGMMVTLDKFIRDTMNPNNIQSSLPSKSLKGAGSLLRYWTEEGLMSWGRTKKGIVTPIVHSNFGLGNISETELATAFDPSLRQKRYSTINAPTFPAIDPTPISEYTNWKQYTKGKDVTGRSSISKSFLSMMKRMPVRINGDMLYFLNKMNEEVNSTWEQDTAQNVGSTHPYAATLGEISISDAQTYIRRDQAAESKETDGVSRPSAPDLIQSHYITINNKLKDINQKFKEQQAGNLKYYPLWYKSGPTGRYFVMDSLFNHINDKGLIRSVLKIGNTQPIVINNTIAKEPRQALSLANQVFNTNRSGILLGETINERLQNLEPHQRQLLGFYYAMGKTANKYGIKNYRKTIENPIEAIENGIDALDSMAEQGIKFRSYLPTKEKPEGAMPNFNSLNPIEQEIFNGNKGEWQVPVSLAINASKFKEAIANNATEFTFDFTFEEDARQSNAALISTMIGDPSISGLLGILPEKAKEATDPVTGRSIPVKDLRELLVSTLPETVRATLNNEEDTEQERASAIIDYFDKVKNENNGAKTITRGLVVAGLYGKYPGRMYTEVEDMLAKTSDHTSILDSAYTVNNNLNREAMVQDLSQIYLTMAQEHMGNLMGYQGLMKSVGKLLGVLEGPTEIDGMFSGEKVLLGIEELYPTTTEEVVGDEVIKITEDVGGFTFPIFDRQTKAISSSPNVTSQRALRARESTGETLMAGDPRTAGFSELGSQVSRALPVNVIQNMDSLALAMSFMVAHGTNKVTPPEATAVHDAILSTADSVLLLNNAYNNIVPNIFAKGGQKFFTNLMKTLHKDTILPYMKLDDDARINIGTDIAVTSGGNLTQLSGITNYFDEIYTYIERDDFFTPEQLKRKRRYGNEIMNESNQEYANKMKEADIAFMAIAEENGYLAPRPNNLNSRSSYAVTGAQLKKLIMLMLEREGLLNKEFASQYSRAFGLDNVSKLSKNEINGRSYRNGNRYKQILNDLKDNSLYQFAKNKKYNRQLD